MTANFDIRPFAEPDWPSVWKIIQSVSEAGETFTYPRDLSEELGRNIWVQPSPGHTVVALDPDDEIVGTAKMGPNQMGPGAHIATASFMVASACRSRGVGRALCAYAIEWARNQGYRAMQFNAVVETNERAVRLWRSLGFEIIGTAPDAFKHAVHGFVGLHIMFRHLD